MNPLLRILLYIFVGYSALVLIVFLLQRRMIFFPDRSKPTKSDIRLMGLKYWPDAEKNYRGFIAGTAPSHPKGSVVIFHGNAGSAWNRDYFVFALIPLGYRVILAEYPGYGGRPGKTGERQFVNDAKATVERVYKDFGGPVYLWGESLGCGVAAAVAADVSVPLEGLIMTTPWNSLSDLAQTLYWYLPAKWLIRDKFDSVRNLRTFNKPVAVLIAENDDVIPRQHSMRLYESLTASKRLWVFAGAGHNSWPTGHNEPWWREVMEFVSKTRTKAK